MGAATMMSGMGGGGGSSYQSTATAKNDIDNAAKNSFGNGGSWIDFGGFGGSGAGASAGGSGGIKGKQWVWIAGIGGVVLLLALFIWKRS